MEQISKKPIAKQKRNGGGSRYDDMGNLIPDIGNTMDGIDAALEASKVEQQQQKKQPVIKSCGC